MRSSIPARVPARIFSRMFIWALFLCAAIPAFADLQIESDRWRSVFAEGREQTVLEGNARVRSDTLNVQANRIELYGESYRYVRAEGALSIVDRERNLYLTGNTLFVDRDLELMRVEGNAEMEDRENELIVRGGLIEHQGHSEVTTVQIGVRILREDLVARAEFARYLRSENILELSGLPSVVRGSDEFRATRILINLDTDEITLRGEVRATIREDEETE